MFGGEFKVSHKVGWPDGDTVGAIVGAATGDGVAGTIDITGTLGSFIFCASKFSAAVAAIAEPIVKLSH